MIIRDWRILKEGHHYLDRFGDEVVVIDSNEKFITVEVTPKEDDFGLQPPTYQDVIESNEYAPWETKS